jgi:hypothetical protein
MVLVDHTHTAPAVDAGVAGQQGQTAPVVHITRLRFANLNSLPQMGIDRLPIKKSTILGVVIVPLSQGEKNGKELHRKHVRRK